MENLVAKFYELYQSIINAQTQASQSTNKESTATEIANSYLAQLTQIKQSMINQYSSYITEKFFYVMIGMYDGIMVKYLTQNCGIASGFFNTNSLEARYYKTANFGQQFFTDASDVLQNASSELMKVYVCVYNLLFANRDNNLRKQFLDKIYSDTKIDSNLFQCEKTYVNNENSFNMQNTYLLPIIVGIVYLVASTVVWESSIIPIKRKIDLMLTKRN